MALSSKNLVYLLAVAHMGVCCCCCFSAQVNVECDITITGGSLPATYKVAQFHFHWGADDTKGSEHQLDGKKYPMEV